jgi:hypothetical protein
MLCLYVCQYIFELRVNRSDCMHVVACKARQSDLNVDGIGRMVSDGGILYWIGQFDCNLGGERHPRY